MYAIELEKISKKFGDKKANDAIDFFLERGEIHCLLGENGAGKSTLMKILFGLYSKDSGHIRINGEERNISKVSQAISLGIGMIHQHFMLVDTLSVTENIIAGAEPQKGLFLDYREARKNVEELSNKYKLRVNPDAKIEDISVGEQQRVEILKALYREADILILDEPTAVLTPQETQELFRVMRELKKDGKTIIFITHKLKETMSISDRVTILRNGKKIATVKTKETNPDELAKMMVGREVLFRVNKEEKRPGEKIFAVKNLSLKSSDNNYKLKDINFSIARGEIVGLAGVEGNGQYELEEVLSGLRDIDNGEIILTKENITKYNTLRRRELGIAHIPSDRLKRGLITTFNLERNIILGSEWKYPFAKNGILLKEEIRNYSNDLINKFDIRTSSSKTLVSSLSGGNQQKTIIARELSRNPEFIIASQPTRGVDIGAIEYIHNLLIKMRDAGKGILLISAELDELMALSDRIMVIYEGEIVAEGASDLFTDKQLGLLMAGHRLEGIDE